MDETRFIEIRDVTPRDGLQDHPRDVPTDVKYSLIAQLHAAGLRSVEITSFVSPKVVPPLADAEALCKLLFAEPLDGLETSAFVATRSGVERALAAGVAELSTTVPATDGMTQANFRRSRDTMADEIAALRGLVGGTAKMSVTIAVAFGCPFDGRVDDATVLRLVEQLVEADYERILLGDTIGVATPSQVTRLFEALASRFPTVSLGAHFHDARGAGLANVVAAVDAGASLVDAALGGMGGCPFAPGAAGNVATEDVVWALSGMGHAVAPDPTAIVEAARWLEKTLDIRLQSKTPSARRFDWEGVGPTQGAN